MENSSGPSANLKRNEPIQWDRESGQIDQVSNSTMHLKSSPSSWNIFSKGHQSNDNKMVAGSVCNYHVVEGLLCRNKSSTSGYSLNVSLSHGRTDCCKWFLGSVTCSKERSQVSFLATMEGRDVSAYE